MAKRRAERFIRDCRLSIRVDAKRKAVIAQAAKQHGVTLSHFVLENAFEIATELLTDEGPDSFSRHQLTHLAEVLDNPPPASVAAVRKLLRERSILDV